MGTGDTLDTGQKEPKQKKFVSTKQRIAAKKLAKQRNNGGENGAPKVRATKPRPPATRPSAPPTIASPLILDNDPLSIISNSTFGSANRLQFPPNTSSEVRRPGWNRPVLGNTVAPVNVFGADLPDPPPSRNIRMLKIGLGVLGGIALLLGSLASILYISKKRRRQNKQNKNRKRTDRSPPGGGGGGQSPNHQYPPPHPMHPGGVGPIPQCSGEYSQYPPNGWQNSLGPMGQNYGPGQNYAPANYNQLPYHGQIPNAAYYGMPYDPYGGHYQIAPGFYPHMNGYHDMGQNPYAQYCDAYGNVQYPESQGDISEVGFDPVLNYVETLGDELKTPKRKPKQRKDGSSTPHPIITRRASCKSVKSEISAWTEDEIETASKAESTYVTQENISLKGSHSGKEETNSEKCKLDGESNKSSPQLSQTNDSAYGSRGSIQSPNSGNPLVIPPFSNGKVVSVQNVPVPVVPQISQYMVDPFNRKMVTMSGTVSQYSSNGQIQQTQLDSNFTEDS